MKNNKQLILKDLVTIGVFFAIYFIMMFAVGMPLGFLVVTYLAFPFAISLTSGILTLFLMAKVKKPWTVFIFTLLPGALMTLMGHTIVVFIHSLCIAILAEIIHRRLGYNSIKGNIITHATLSLWFVGPFYQIFIMQDIYYAMTKKMMGEAYASSFMSLPIWIIPLLYITSFVGGIIGGKIGAKVLNKHFKKAGLVK